MKNQLILPKNEAINRNIDMLVGDEFTNALVRESIGGNAGTMHAGVNAYYDSIGRITEFSNYAPKKEGKKRVTFRVDVNYLLDYREWYEKLYKKKNDKWTIDGIYFEDKTELPEIKNLIEEAVSYVNKMSRKQREKRSE